MDINKALEVARKLGINDFEVQERMKYIEFTQHDIYILNTSHKFVSQHQKELVESFYNHILSFEDNKNLIEHCKIGIDKLEKIQYEYFESLSVGIYDIDYFINRINIGLTHERIGLDFKWLFGAYRKYLSGLYEFFEHNPYALGNYSFNQVLDAYNKIIHLDLGLITDAYIFVKQERIRNLEFHQSNLIQGIDGFIWEFDVNSYRYRYVSKKAEMLLGYKNTLWMNHPEFQMEITSHDFKSLCLEKFNDAIERGEGFEIEYQVIAADGNIIWISERVTTEKDENNNTSLLRGLIVDITERKLQEQKLYDLGHFDELTGLPNRTSFATVLKKSINEASRYHRQVALMFLDLDGFKQINDNFGHSVGDELLRLFSHRVRYEVLRESDFMARLGGDEFCILIKNLSQDYTPVVVAERCLTSLSLPIEVGTRNIFPRVSIGIALFPDDASDAEKVMVAADNAMYAAKQAGKHQFAFYNQEMSEKAEARLRIESAFRNAVTQKLFYLEYQPQISLVTGKPFAVEALLRWHDPNLGNIPPDIFIPIAEQLGLIIDVGEWVIDQACLQMKEWINEGLEIEYVAVNISSSHFCSKSLPYLIEETINRYGIINNHFQLEITEGMLQTQEEVRDTFHKIKNIGIKIAIDDFGTGYSCLNSLTYLPVDCLKIDRTFISNILKSQEDAAIVSTILAMSKILNFSAVAEGVESLEQVQLLIGLGCKYVQGYFFSKPLPAIEIKKMWSNNYLP